MMRRCCIATVLWASLAFGQTDGLELGRPSRGDVIHHRGFSLCYSEEHEQAAWVAYTLTAAEVRARAATRDTMRWGEDPLVKTGSARFEDYRESGFDKGHLAPAADMRWSITAMRESFLLSNASPQRREFNGGIWEEIESAARNFAVEYDSVYVVTGPVLRKGLPTIGRDKVSIPEYFYKAILTRKVETYEALGFVCRNEPSDLPIGRFAVTVDSIEALTGLDFFNVLPDDVENRIEGKIDVKWWMPKGRKLPQR